MLLFETSIPIISVLSLSISFTCPRRTQITCLLSHGWKRRMRDSKMNLLQGKDCISLILPHNTRGIPPVVRFSMPHGCRSQRGKESCCPPKQITQLYIIIFNCPPNPQKIFLHLGVIVPIFCVINIARS